MQSQQTLAERTEESTQDHKVWHQSENALEKFQTLGSHITSLEDALPLKPGIFLDPNPVPSPPPEISLGLKGSAECTALHILRGCVQNSRKGQYEKGVQDLSSTKREKPCIHVHHVRTLTLSEAKWPEGDVRRCEEMWGDVRRCEEMCKMAWCPYLQLQLLLCTAQSCQTQGCHGLCVQKTDRRNVGSKIQCTHHWHRNLCVFKIPSAFTAWKHPVVPLDVGL